MHLDAMHTVSAMPTPRSFTLDTIPVVSSMLLATDIPASYLAVVVWSANAWLFQIRQAINGRELICGSWSLVTLLGVDRYNYGGGKPLNVRDRLAIDDGQNWYVENANALLAEATRMVLGMPPAEVAR